uniref:Uncharacterized protein n=1 Tax=Rhizophora mucronata TaxID=61149 RepID=A0A2P2Q997_RHIMU
MQYARRCDAFRFFQTALFFFIYLFTYF